VAKDSDNVLAEQTFTLVSVPNSGSLSLNPDGSFTYTADAGVAGTDGFSYQVMDPAGNTDIANYSIDIIPMFTPVTSTETQVNTTSLDSQIRPSVTALTDGGYVIVWGSYGQDGSGWGMFGQRYDASGNTLGIEFQVNTSWLNDQIQPNVTSLTDGGFLVTWSSYVQDGSGYGVYGQRFDASGNMLGGEFQANTTTVSHQYYQAGAGLKDGGYVIVWESKGEDGSQSGIFGSRYDSTGNVVDANFMVNTNIFNSQQNAEVTALADGGFVVVWQSFGQDGAREGIFGQQYDSNGNKVTAEFQINTYTVNNQMLPNITALDDGGYVVVWESWAQAGDSTFGIFGQRFDASGNMIGSEFHVNTTTTDYQDTTRVSGLADGGFFVTWDSYNQDDSGYGVYGQRFDVVGNKVGSEMQISDSTLDNQEYSSVTTLQDGTVVVTWESFGQDGSGDGVYSKHINIDPPPEMVITGTTGNDGFMGGDGNDTFIGAGGEDTFVGGAGADYFEGGAGLDAVSYVDSDTGVTIDLQMGTGSGGDAQGDTFVSIDKVIGSAYDDSLFGGTGKDYFEGGGGADYIDGGLGKDEVAYTQSSSAVTIDLSTGLSYGGDANGDTLVSIENVEGSYFADSITGDDGSNDLQGLSGDDTLQGMGGNDKIYAGRGNDSLIGGTGDDQAYGNDGADIYVFGFGDGNDTFGGGLGAWTDVIQLQGMPSGPGGGDWTVVTDNSADMANANTSTTHIDFISQDISGTITLSDGSSLDFENIERIEW